MTDADILRKAKDRIMIDLGWLSAPLTEQLAGIVAIEDAQNFDIDVRAINRLRARGYMTDSQRAAIDKKLLARISKAVDLGAQP